MQASLQILTVILVLPIDISSKYTFVSGTGMSPRQIFVAASKLRKECIYEHHELILSDYFL